MKKQFLCLSIFLISCASNHSSSSILNSSSEECLSSSFSSSNQSFSPSIELSEDILGTWYIYSNSTDIVSLNTKIEVDNNNHLVLGNLDMYYQGQFAEYENSYYYLSASKISSLVIELSDDKLAWGFEDTSGNKDFGFASREEYSSEIKYDYQGNVWPMELANNFLNNDGYVPSYENKSYRLRTGISQLYDIKYAEIDILNIQEDDIKEYVRTLNLKGFTISKDQYSSFYIGSDDEHKYYLRIIEFSSDNEISLFIYNYDEFVK